MLAYYVYQTACTHRVLNCMYSTSSFHNHQIESCLLEFTATIFVHLTYISFNLFNLPNVRHNRCHCSVFWSYHSHYGSKSDSNCIFLTKTLLTCSFSRDDESIHTFLLSIHKPHMPSRWYSAKMIHWFDLLQSSNFVNSPSCIHRIQIFHPTYHIPQPQYTSLIPINDPFMPHCTSCNQKLFYLSSDERQRSNQVSDIFVNPFACSNFVKISFLCSHQTLSACPNINAFKP